jgi:hypothetical protein
MERFVKTNPVSTAGGVDESYIWVYVNEISEMAKFGMHFPPPGMEAAFVASLPVEVRQRYE